jgi:hypothetical protein
MPDSNTLLKIDSTNFDFSDIEFNSIPELELTLDLGHLIMKNQISKTFDDLLKETPDKKENLYILSQIRLMLYNKGHLRIINTYNGKIDESYIKRMTILLNTVGFVDIKIKEQENIQIINSVKRPLESKGLGNGLVFKEIIHPDEISKCHQFAKNFYYYKDLNYDLNVVKKFDLNCDTYVVYDSENEICSFSRIISRTPGYYCPFMYATIAGEIGNKHFTIPGKDEQISEVMAIYSVGRKGVVAFKRMMEYGASIMKFDSMWTTYDDEDEYTGTYYKNRFLMKSIGIKLKYSDFGGSWNLLVTDKMTEMKKFHDQIFKYK